MRTHHAQTPVSVLRVHICVKMYNGTHNEPEHGEVARPEERRERRIERVRPKVAGRLLRRVDVFEERLHVPEERLVFELVSERNPTVATNKSTCSMLPSVFTPRERLTTSMARLLAFHYTRWYHFAIPSPSRYTFVFEHILHEVRAYSLAVPQRLFAREPARLHLCHVQRPPIRFHNTSRKARVCWRDHWRRRAPIAYQPHGAKCYITSNSHKSYRPEVMLTRI